MTAEIKWIQRLPRNETATGTYWAYNNVSENYSLAEVEWSGEKHIVHMPYLGTVIPHPHVSTFMRDHEWLPIKKPTPDEEGWVDELPKESSQESNVLWASDSGVYWVCNRETGFIFAVAVGWMPIGMRVYSPKSGLLDAHPKFSTFLKDHMYMRIDEPSLTTNPSPSQVLEMRRLNKEGIWADDVS